ncbi:MAG: hypothetical protein U9Q83_07775 [Bacteroidota bacterium]|nr:hypothetical protein [Bacteroidota bacterium]
MKKTEEIEEGKTVKMSQPVIFKSKRIDLKKIEQEIDLLLNSETEESLSNWLFNKRSISNRFVKK